MRPEIPLCRGLSGDVATIKSFTPLCVPDKQALEVHRKDGSRAMRLEFRQRHPHQVQVLTPLGLGFAGSFAGNFPRMVAIFPVGTVRIVRSRRGRIC